MAQIGTNAKTRETPALAQEVRPYFDAAREGRLLVKYCASCGLHHHYPRTMCPHCHSGETEWVESSGRGTLYSFAVSAATAGAVHVLAYVTLDDCKVTMLTNIQTEEPSALEVGAPVVVAFRASQDGLIVPVFVPA